MFVLSFPFLLFACPLVCFYAPCVLYCAILQALLIYPPSNLTISYLMIKFNGIAYLDGYDQGKKEKMNARVSPKNSKHAAEPP